MYCAILSLYGLCAATTRHSPRSFSPRYLWSVTAIPPIALRARGSGVARKNKKRGRLELQSMCLRCSCMWLTHDPDRFYPNPFSSALASRFVPVLVSTLWQVAEYSISATHAITLLRQENINISRFRRESSPQPAPY